MESVNLIFPHQLFKKSPLLENTFPIILVEEFLFFKQYKFHKQKIAFHRASMKSYAAFLKNLGKDIVYIDATEPQADIRQLIPKLHAEGLKKVYFINPTDNWLEKRLLEGLKTHDIDFKEYENQLFLNSREDLSSFFRTDKKKFFQTKFYIQERKKRGILLEGNDGPVGGKWSFDAENRKK